MPVNFPPTVVFPNAIDNDYTLFLVHNTTESVTTSNNGAWSDEISIKPQPADRPEIWPDNGFATISGEMFYYDSVEKNNNDRVIKLKDCVRNLSGESTRFNPIGTEVRGFVIAEHHNQIVDAIIEIEKFVGRIECDDSDTITCCLDELDVPECVDDGVCPNVNFDYDIEPVADISQATCVGVNIAYNVDVSGNFNNFRLDFGDGTYTTLPGVGTHTYSPGAIIDPVVTVSNRFCEVVVTGIQRDQDDEPQQVDPEVPIFIQFPQIDFPPLIFPEIVIPPTDIQIPPIVIPCFDFEPFGIGPISIGDISIPDTITIIPPTLNPISVIPPVLNDISLIVPTLGPISITPPDLNPISIIPPDLNPISIIPPDLNPISIIAPDLNPISITPGEPIQVEWGTPPTLSCTVSVVCPGSASSMAMRASRMSDYDANIGSMSLDYETANMPTNFTMELPELPSFKIDSNDLPKSISIDVPQLPDINVVVPSLPDIKIAVPNAFPAIEIDAKSIPTKLMVDWGDAPRSLDVNVPEFPTIKVEHNIPDVIRVEGMSDTISITGFPEYIPLRIENANDLVMKVEPAEVKISMDIEKLISDKEGSKYCFGLVPCNPS